MDDKNLEWLTQHFTWSTVHSFLLASTTPSPFSFVPLPPRQNSCPSVSPFPRAPHRAFPTHPPLCFPKWTSSLAVESSRTRLSRHADIRPLESPVRQGYTYNGHGSGFQRGSNCQQSRQPLQLSLAYAWLVWQFSRGLVGIGLAYRASIWHLGSPFARPAWPVIPVYGTAISCSFPPSQIWLVTL